MRADGTTRTGAVVAASAAGRTITGAGRLLVTVAMVSASLSGTVLASDAPDASAAPAGPALSPAPSPDAGPGPRPIHLATTSMMQILDDAGRPMKALAVRPGETLAISVSNGARFAHNLFIGPHDALAADQTADLSGVDDFAGGARTFLWTVPASVEDLWFGCTVVGHFSVMQGRVVVVAESMPDVVGLAEADALAILDASGLLAVERLEAADPTIPAGTVLAQEPPPGAPVDPATVVRITVSSGPPAAG